MRKRGHVIQTGSSHWVRTVFSRLRASSTIDCHLAHCSVIQSTLGRCHHHRWSTIGQTWAPSQLAWHCRSILHRSTLLYQYQCGQVAVWKPQPILVLHTYLVSFTLEIQYACVDKLIMYVITQQLISKCVLNVNYLYSWNSPNIW